MNAPHIHRSAGRNTALCAARLPSIITVSLRSLAIASSPMKAVGIGVQDHSSVWLCAAGMLRWKLYSDDPLAQIIRDPLSAAARRLRIALSCHLALCLRAFLERDSVAPGAPAASEWPADEL